MKYVKLMLVIYIFGNEIHLKTNTKRLKEVQYTTKLIMITNNNYINLVFDYDTICICVELCKCFDQ